MQIYSQKISEVFIICFKNVGAKNSAAFISCKVTYLNILFLSDFNRFLKLSSLLQFRLRVHPLPPLGFYFAYIFWGDIFPCSFILFFSPPAPPLPPPLNHFSSGPFLNHLLIYSKLNKGFSLTRCQLLAVWSG